MKEAHAGVCKILSGSQRQADSTCRGGSPFDTQPVSAQAPCTVVLASAGCLFGLVVPFVADVALNFDVIRQVIYCHTCMSVLMWPVPCTAKGKRRATGVLCWGMDLKLQHEVLPWLARSGWLPAWQQCADE